MKVEIFKVGKWNGMEFNAEDLRSIALSFSKLKDVHQVPLKFGHNNEQPVTDGQPALGWVNNVWYDESTSVLMAEFSDVPEIVSHAFKKNLYRNVSVELDVGVSYKGVEFQYVLSGVALLGADIPAVNELNDLKHYMKREAANFSKSSRINFTFDNKDSTMDELEKAKAKIATLEAQIEASSEQAKANALEFSKAQEKLNTLQTEMTAKAEADKKAHFAASRQDFEKRLDGLVKSNVILPAKRDQLIGEFSENDGAIEKLDFSIGLLEEMKPAINMEGDNGMTGEANDSGESADAQLLSKVQQVRAENPTVSFSVAKTQVLKANPELAREYLTANGK